MLSLIVKVQSALLSGPRASGDRGQTTAEYGLLLLGAAAVALLVLAWATKTNKVSQLLNAVIDSVISKVV